MGLKPIIVEKGEPPENFYIPGHYVHDVKEVLISNAQLRERIKEMAKEIYSDYLFLGVKSEELYAICILKGAKPFYEELLVYMEMMKNNQNEFLMPRRVSKEINTYIGLESAQDYKKDKIDFSFAENKHVLIIEDIIDSGKLMNNLVPHIQEYNPSSIRIATLFTKKKKGAPEADYTGFIIPSDEFVVGFGMDLAEKYRDLSHTCILTQEAINTGLKAKLSSESKRSTRIAGSSYAC